ALVMGMHIIRRYHRHPQRRMLTAGIPDLLRIARTRRGPVSHTLELDPPDHRLHLGHPPVGTKALMQPAEPRRMLLLVYRIPGLTVILVRPHALPQLAVIGGHHATLTARSHDLVLAERPGTHMADGANRTALVARTMGLGAILDHIQPALLGQLHDRVHITGQIGRAHV